MTSQAQRIRAAAAGAELAPKPRRLSEPDDSPAKAGAKAAAARRTAASVAAKGAPGQRGQPAPRHGSKTVGAAAQQHLQLPIGSRPTAKHGPSTRADPCARSYDPLAVERTRSYSSAKLMGQEHAWYADTVNDEDGGNDNCEAVGTEAMADAALHKSTALLKQLASLQLDLDGESDGMSALSGMMTPNTRWPAASDLADDMSEVGSNERQQEMAAIWRCLRDLEERLDRGEGASPAFRNALGDFKGACGSMGNEFFNSETFLDGLNTAGSQATARTPMASPRAASSLTNTWTSLPWSSASTPPTSPSARGAREGRGAVSTGSLAKTARAAACGNHPGSPRQISMLGVPSSPCLSLGLAGLPASASSPVFRTCGRTPSAPVLTGGFSPQATLGLGWHQAWPTSPTSSGMLTMVRTSSMMHQSSVPKLSL